MPYFPSNQREYVHRHNALYGNVKMIRQLIWGIENSPSVTHEGREYASAICELLDLLEPQVYNYRVEPDGSIRTIQHKEPK